MLNATSRWACCESFGSLYRWNTAACRTQNEDADKWFAGLHHAVEENLCFLGQEQVEPTPGHCESIIRLYEGLYSLATRLGNRSVPPNSASLTRHWLKKSLELSGWRRPLLLRRLMGLRLYTFLKKCALSPRLRDFAFRLRRGFRGVPFQIGDRTIRLDESLRRWHVGGESQVQEVLLANLKAGDCMVHVGANFGLRSLLAGMIVGLSGEVHALEPLPSNVEKLRRNVRLNQLESVVRIIPSAISDSRDTEVTFFSRANEIDVPASLVESVGDTKELKVANTQLDDYLPLIRGPVRLLKIGVEGAELKLLRRGKELLKAHKPILTIKVHAFAFPQFSTSLKGFREFLNGLGYDEEILPGTSLRNGLHYQAVCRDRNHQPREIGA